MVLADLRAYFSHLKYASKIMITQHEYVAGCLAWYKEADLQPGNPEDGVWHEAHYPIPKCLGGTEVILLLEEHHAVQGVLQSEEFQHPCIWGWEEKYIPEDYKKLFYHWSYVRQRIGWEAMFEKMTPEDRRIASERGIQTKLSQDPHFFYNLAKRQTAKQLEKDPLHFSKMGKRARELETQKVRSARGHNIPKEAKAAGVAKTNARRVRCLVTGKISTPGPLTVFQVKRGIDPTLREEITNDQEHA